MKSPITSRSCPMLVALASLSIHCAVLWPRGGFQESLGAPANGALLASVSVPERARAMQLLRTEAEGGQRWATRRLRDAVLESAQRVEQLAPGGAELVVGDFSARYGGRIERHRSHRNGRDVDLLYYVVDAGTGRSIRAQGFIRFDGEGLPRDRSVPVRMDLRRNWLLVESLVREERYGVLWIFCAAWLEQLLLRWAREHEQDPRWIERAELVLHQPGDAAPHDDHFHVRVACTTDERVRGCVDGGPSRWWLRRTMSKPDAAPQDDAGYDWAIPSRTLVETTASPRARSRTRGAP